MDRQPAKVLEPDDVRRLLTHVAGHRHDLRNRVIILLSFKAGLRACEIAGLTWPMLLTPSGAVGTSMSVTAAIAKMGSARRIPIHAELRRALRQLHRKSGHPTAGPVILSQRLSAMTPASIVNWFAALYRDMGLDGCSSHSGRRTFITRSAQVIAKTGGSLRDIQELAGHRALTTTERYIAGDRDAQRKLIALI